MVLPRRSLVLAVACLGLTAVVYSGALRNPFVYEDANNSLTVAPLAPTAALRQFVDLSTGAWNRFMVRQVVGLSYRWGNGAPWAYHLMNVVLHLLNGVLVYWLFTRMKVPAPLPLLSMYIFLLHALGSEAVLYAVEVAEVLATTWLLLACVALTYRTPWRGGIALLCYGGALLTKVSAVSGIGLLCMVYWDYAPRSRRWERWSLGLGSAGLALGFALVVLHRVAIDPAQQSTFSPLQFVAWQATALCRYVVLFLVPYGQSLDHDFEVVPYLWQLIALGTLLLGGLVWTFLWIAPRFHYTDRRMEYALWGVLWAAVDLVPRFLMRVTEAINEHQMYRPMIGWALTAAVCCSWCLPYLQPAGYADVSFLKES